MIKNFTITKINKKEGQDKAPDRRLSAKVGENWVDIGCAWVKVDKNGNQYLSVKMNDEYKDHTDATKSRKGFHIVEDGEIEQTEDMTIELDTI